MEEQVTWSEISHALFSVVDDCEPDDAWDNQRAIVDVFHQYEGQTTDELTAHGRPVKVTISSFGRHFATSDKMQYWVNNVDRKKPKSDAFGSVY